MSSSPEQSDAAGGNLPHNTSTTSVISALSVSGGESPPGPHHTSASALLMSPQLGHLSSASSTPNSPHLSSRPSSGKHSRGKSVKKFLHGWKQIPTPTHSQPATVPEDPLESNDHTNKARMTRKLRKGWPQPMKFGRNFRRIRRRAGDKQYHSDDGYTSDPGIIREEEDDDETDENTEATDSTDVRRINLIRDTQRKLEKQRRLLHDEEESVGGVNYQDYTGDLLQIESDKQMFRRLRLHKGNKADQYKKKIAKLETDLRVLQEGGPLEARYGGYGGGLRGRIEGSIRGMSLSGLKGKLSNAGNRLMLRRRVPTSEAVPDDENLDVDDDDDDTFPDDEMTHVSVEVLAPQAEAELMKEQLVSVRESSEEFLQESQKLREELNIQTETLVRLEETMNVVYEKLEQERERAERLENQINDITELHQHEVGELRANLAQMESMTMGKSQDLEEAMETCQAKMDRLDAHVHHLIDSGERPARNLVRRPMADLLTFVLVSFAFLLKVVSILRTKLGLGVAVFILLLALLLYYLFYYQ